MAVRIISAIVGIAVAALILFFHSTVVLNIAVGLISAVMLFEVLRAGKCGNSMPVVFLTSLVYAFAHAFAVDTKYSYHVTLLYVAVIFAEFIFMHKKLEYSKVFFTLATSLMIPAAMGTLVLLNDLGGKNGIMYLIMGLCGAWLADTGAYFVGTFMGKNKLCPEISPKKTIEGFIGGILITGFLFMLINFIYAKASDSGVHVNYFEVCVLGMLMAVIGTLGDLSASVLKRQCDIKDYGNIMPGHGGLMDRFDSVVFTAPFLLAFVSLFEIYFY